MTKRKELMIKRKELMIRRRELMIKMRMIAHPSVKYSQELRLTVVGAAACLSRLRRRVRALLGREDLVRCHILFVLNFLRKMGSHATCMDFPAAELFAVGGGWDCPGKGSVIYFSVVSPPSLPFIQRSH